jgi:2-dehydro-3-deoxygluconokinase
LTRVACIGECMVELTMPPRGQTGGSIGYAGDAFNTAVYLRREGGRDVSVSFVTGLGRDDLSERMLEFFASHDIATGLVQRRDDRNPGLYAISVDAAGERTFTYWRENSAARTLFQAPADVRPESLAGFDLIYLSGITLAVLSAEARADLLAFLPGFRAGGGRVAFDSNYRPRLWPDVATARRVMRAYWTETDIALPSVDDEMALWNDTDEEAVLARLDASGVATGALKRGSVGPLAIGWDGPLPDFPAAERVVDTTAAGDSFNGAYLAAFLRGDDPPGRLAAGHAMARHVVGYPGAIAPE